jgi:uncharacterized protein YecE (DUF72 family)
MVTRLHIGARTQRGSGTPLAGSVASYAKRFDLLEVTAGAPASPNAATMRRWRRAVAPHFDFSVVAGPNLSRLKAGEALEQELAAARDAIDALQALCFVLPTPAEVTPSPLWRDRLRKVLDRLPRDATHVIWEPGGVWEIDDAANAARRWEIVLAVDAARDPVPDGPIAYVRLRALGETRSFGPSALERVLRAIGVRRDAYIVLETPSAKAEAKRLRQLAREATHASAGGLGRLVRPRGSVKVRDDEQE